MSSIAGQSLFNSGPHRFALRAVGTLFVPPLTIDPFQTTINTVAPLEVRLVQTGRLIGSSELDLLSQIEAIRAQSEAQLTGTLFDNSGRTWTNMTLLRFKPEDRFDRGREVSVGYRADYVRLAV